MLRERIQRATLASCAQPSGTRPESATDVRACAPPSMPSPTAGAPQAAPRTSVRRERSENRKPPNFIGLQLGFMSETAAFTSAKSRKDRQHDARSAATTARTRSADALPWIVRRSPAPSTPRCTPALTPRRSRRRAPVLTPSAIARGVTTSLSFPVVELSDCQAMPSCKLAAQLTARLPTVAPRSPCVAGSPLSTLDTSGVQCPRPWTLVQHGVRRTLTHLAYEEYEE